MPTVDMFPRRPIAGQRWEVVPFWSLIKYSSFTKRLGVFAAAVIVLVSWIVRRETIMTLSSWTDGGKWETRHSFDINTMSHNKAGLPLRVQTLQRVVSSLSSFIHRSHFMLYFSLEGEQHFIFTLFTWRSEVTSQWQSAEVCKVSIRPLIEPNCDSVAWGPGWIKGALRRDFKQKTKIFIGWFLSCLNKQNEQTFFVFMTE